MPWTEVMGKYKAGSLHSGSKGGPIVKSQKQAVAILLSEKKSGKAEYKKKKKKYVSVAHLVFGKK